MENNEMKVVLGCDPEFFLTKDKKGVSAFGIISGTKHNPQIVPNGAVQVDGMALEFNIDPAHNEGEWIKNIDSVLKTLRGMVDSDLKFAIKPTMNFNYDYMRTLPEEALELGCDPDYCAWTNGERNPRPNGNRPFRTAAGHIHFSWEGSEDAPLSVKLLMIKVLDLFLGIPSLSWDKDKKRRSMYGKAGCFRNKSYGFEYRTLSNQWLKNNKLKKFVYNQAVKAINMFPLMSRVVNDTRIQEAINTSNVELANEILKDYPEVGVEHV